jgi:CheY-like chemotaxis protein
MKKNILILDTRPDLWSSIKTTLEKANYNVTTVVNPEDCLEKLTDCNPDLILMDVTMPRTPLEKIIRQIRKTKIAYLNIVKTSDSEILRRDKVEGSIQKPLHVDEIVTRVNYLMSDSKFEVKKEMENSRTILVMIPNVDYDTTVASVISQLKTEKVCYITLNKTYEAMKDFLGRKKIPIANMTFIDGITRTVIHAEDKKNCYFISSPGALDELTETISRSLRDFRYLIFDSLTDLLTYRCIEEVEGFVGNITDLLSRNKCKGIFYAVSRYKYALENRLSEIMSPKKSAPEKETLVEEQIASIDKTIDLRKKKYMNSFSEIVEEEEILVY